MNSVSHCLLQLKRLLPFDRTVRRRRSRQPFLTDALEPRCLLAATPLAPEFQVNESNGDVVDSVPAVARNIQGTTLIVWKTENAGFIARTIASNGVAGNQFVLDDGDANTGFDVSGTADVAVDDSGHFLVVWDEIPLPGAPSDVVRKIVGQKFSPDGSPLDGAIDLVTHDDPLVFPGHNPKIAMDRAGNFAIAYTRQNDVFVRRFSKSGSPGGGEISVAEVTPGVTNHRDHEIAMAANGDFVVVWSRVDSGMGTTDIVAHRYTASGVGRGAEITVNPSRDQFNSDPAVAMAGDGTFVVSWTSTTADSDDFGILGNAFDRNGAEIPLGSFLVNTTTRRAQEHSDISIDRDGVTFTVVWDGFFLEPGIADHRKIFLQQFRLERDPTSSTLLERIVPSGGEMLVNPTEQAGRGSVGSFLPVVAGSHCGDLVVAWDVNEPVNEIFARTYSVEQVPDLATYDSDGDALPDCWEMHGYSVTVEGVEQFVDLPAMGANPLHKDIFVEIDYMVDQRPKDAAMKIVRNSFAAAPVDNPDGLPGITLHIDHGDLSPMHPGPDGRWHSADDALWQSLGSRSEVVPKVQLLDNPAGNDYNFSRSNNPPDQPLSFDDLKFGPDGVSGTLDDRFSAARAAAFHYAIFAFTIDADESSGISRNADDAAFFDGAGDFIVSLGGWAGTVFEQAGTFMHELGHNLGLAHGGGDGVNYKPNYLSIMNYTFQLTGLYKDRDDSGNFRTGTFDYSRWNLDTLNEAELNENAGLNGDGFNALRFGTVFYNGNVERTHAKSTAAVDWNSNGDSTEPQVAVDINGDGRFAPPESILKSYNDWQHLVFSGGGIGGLGAGGEAPATTVFDELTFDEASELSKDFAVLVSGPPQLHSTAGSSVQVTFAVQNLGTHDDTYSLAIESLKNWGDAGSFPVTILVAAGQSVDIVVTVNVPANAISTDVDELTLIATSQANSVLLDVATTTIDLATSSGIAGHKWHDLNGNGSRDANEPGLDGWIIEVTNGSGQVIATTMTESVDLDNDGQIDPLTESGLYQVNVPVGSWTVQEVPQDGWRQTTPTVDPLAETAFRLDSEFDIHVTSNIFEDWGGLGEKWFYSRDVGGWLYVVPDGGVFRWNGSDRGNLSGTKVDQLDASYHQDISLIHAAARPGGRIVDVVAEQTTTGIDFGNEALGAIEGRKWNDLNADGVRDANEPWLNGWTVTLADAAGNVIMTTTEDRDLNNDQVIDPETEAGWFVFEQLGSGSFELSEEERPGWSQTFPDRQIAQTAFDLDQSRNFRATGTDFRNWGGMNERWIWSNEGWHYITEDGDLFQWDGSLRTALTGSLIASLSPDYWLNIERLHEAVAPGRYRVRVNSARVSDINFGNVRI